LSEEIDLVRQEDVSAFQLAKIEPLSSQLVWTRHERVDVLGHPVPEIESMSNDGFQGVLFFWLEWKIGYVVLPVLQVFDLRSRSITRNLDPIIANRTSVLVVIFYFAASNL
jgi:hypothetical protein